MQVIGPLLCQVGAEQHIQHQHPHPQAQGIVQGQRLHGLLPGDHVAAAQQGGDGHQGQAHAAAAQAKRHRPHGKVPQKRQHQRRHQGRAGQEVRQLPVALGGHEKRHEKRAHRSQQIRAGGQQPDDDAAQGHHTIDRLPRSHKRPRHRQQYGKICAAQPEPLCIPAKPGKKCIQSPARPGPQAPRQIKRRHPHSTLRSFTAETTFLDTWKNSFFIVGPGASLPVRCGASNPLPRVLYHKKFEKFVNIWGISSPTRAQRPSIVYFITFRLVCQPGKSTFFSR